MRRILHAPYVFLPLVMGAVAHFFWAVSDSTFGQTKASHKREEQSVSKGATDARERLGPPRCGLLPTDQPVSPKMPATQ